MLDERTPEQIKEAILAGLAGAMDTREGSFAQDIIGPTAMELWKTKEQRRALASMFYIDESSGPYIDKACGQYGITRKPGIKARALLEFDGAAGTVIPQGKIFLAGALEYALEEQVILVDGTGQGYCQGVEPGKAYNQEAGRIGAQYENIPGLNGVRSGPATGGIDQESNKALVERYYAALGSPATSGNKNHYKQWAKEVPGVGDADVVPQMHGTGTVGVILVDQDFQPVPQSVAESCAQHIEELRPIGASVTVTSAQGLPLNIAAKVRINAATTVEGVQLAFAKALESYCKQAAFVAREILYNRIAFMLLDIPGVEDYSDLTLNGGKGNVAVGIHQVPLVGTLEVSLWS